MPRVDYPRVFEFIGSGGEGGIRTPGTGLGQYDGLATNGRPFRLVIVGLAPCPLLLDNTGVTRPFGVTSDRFSSASYPNSWWQFGGNFLSHLPWVYSAPGSDCANCV